MMFAQSTIYLKTLLDNPETKGLIDKALSTYPVYTPENPALYTVIPTREEINTKLLNYYKYREIGFETIGRFVDELEISMNEIMPYYNQLMKSEDMMNNIEDIFSNVDVTEQYDEQTTGKSEGNSEVESTGDTTTTTANTSETGSETNSTMNNKTVRSDTPQNNLSVPAQGIDSVSYASEVSWGAEQGNSNSTVNATENGTNTSESSQTSTGSNTLETQGTTTHTMTKKGNQGVNTYAHDMLEFRQLFQNIVQQIINDKRISELFMLVY